MHRCASGRWQAWTHARLPFRLGRASRKHGYAFCRLLLDRPHGRRPASFLPFLASAVRSRGRGPRQVADLVGWQGAVVAGGGRGKQGHLVDALAPRGDEGRGTLRQAPGSREQALIRGSPNGATPSFLEDPPLNP